MGKRVAVGSGYICTAALAQSLKVAPRTIQGWCKLGLITDLRVSGRGAYFFGIEEVYKAVALAPVSRARSFTKKKYLEDPSAFDKALTSYLAKLGRGVRVRDDQKNYFMVDEDGYMEGWYFPELAAAAKKVYKEALRIQDDSPHMKKPPEKFDPFARE